MMKLHSALLVIFSLLLLLATTKSQDFPVGSCGDQAGGALCPTGFCCSKWGWCGNTSDYCDDENCQSQCPTPPSPPLPLPPPIFPSPLPPPQEPIYCGIDHGGATCPPTMCCLTTGVCSPLTSLGCSSGFCQSQCPPSPSPPPPPPSPPPPPPPQGPILCGVFHGGATCPPTMCCTVMGFCENSRGPWCTRELCQSQCGGTPTCGVDAGGAICGRAHCCTKDGSCVSYNAPVCLAPFCQNQCRYVPVEPAGNSMLKAIG